MFAKPTMHNSTIVPYILLPVFCFFCFFYDVPLLQQTHISPTIDFTSCPSCWCSRSDLKRGLNQNPPRPRSAANVSLQINNGTTRKLTTELGQVALFRSLKPFETFTGISYFRHRGNKKKKNDSSNLALAC